jgi:hypothetical protein
MFFHLINSQGNIIGIIDDRELRYIQMKRPLKHYIHTSEALGGQMLYVDYMRNLTNRGADCHKQSLRAVSVSF